MSFKDLPKIRMRNGQMDVHDPFAWLCEDSEPVQNWLDQQKANKARYLTRHLDEIERLEHKIRQAFHSKTTDMPKYSAGFYFARSYGPQAQDWGISISEDVRHSGETLITDQDLSQAGSTPDVRDFAPSPDGRHLFLLVCHEGSEAHELVLIKRTETAYDILARHPSTGRIIATWAGRETVLFTCLWEQTPTLYALCLEGRLSKTVMTTLPEACGFAIEHSPDFKRLLFICSTLEKPGYEIYVSENTPPYACKKLTGQNFDHCRFGGWVPEGIDLVVKTKANGRKLVRYHEKTQSWTELFRDPHLIGAQSTCEGQSLLAFRTSHGSVTFGIFQENATMHRLSFPLQGSLKNWGVHPDKETVLIEMECWNSTAQLFEFDFKSRSFQALRKPPLSLKIYPKFHEVPSHDESLIPVTLLTPDNRSLCNPLPCIIQGYGGFGQGMYAMCLNWLTPWFEKGGLVAIAHVRGGDERGPQWHEQGKGKHKINAFFDYTHVAQWLINQNITSPDRLNGFGISFGGTLALGASLMRPDLFASCVCVNALTDLAHYQDLNPNNSWVDEFGDSLHDPQALKNISNWSPLHLLKEGQSYPRYCLIAGQNDAIVSPHHSRKMAAALETILPDEQVLYCEQEAAGHTDLDVSLQALSLEFMGRT